MAISFWISFHYNGASTSSSAISPAGEEDFVAISFWIRFLCNDAKVVLFTFLMLHSYQGSGDELLRPFC